MQINYEISIKFRIEGEKDSSGTGIVRHGGNTEGIDDHRIYRKKVSVTEDFDGKYIFNVNKKWDIDGSPRFNTARHVNHSCRSNCEAINRRGRIFIVAKKNIKAGEELYYHYGKDYFEGLIVKNGCLCEKCHQSVSNEQRTTNREQEARNS